MEVYHLMLKLPTFLSRSWSPSVGGDRLKGPLQSFISEVEVVLSVSHCCKVRADVGWWFANLVCGIVTAELRNRLHLFEWWMVWGRLGSLCGESLWAVEQAAVMDVVSPAILFTFCLLISFLCTQWAEAHSRRPVTHRAGSENILMHAWTHSLTANMCTNVLLASDFTAFTSIFFFP